MKTNSAANTLGRSLLALFFTFCTGVHAQSWNAAADFAATNNPDQVWQYGYTQPDGSGFTNFAVLQVDHIPGMREWSAREFDMGVVKNTTGADKQYNLCTLQQPDVLNVSPANDGRKSVVRWKAPTAATYRIGGRFQDLDTTTSDVSIVRNQNTGQPLFADEISDNTCNATAVTKPFLLTVALAAGDTIDFRVGWGSNSNYSHDGTGLAVDITALSNGDEPRVLWAAGNDLVANEKPDHPGETNAVNETVPEWRYGHRTSVVGPDLTLFTAQEHERSEEFKAEGWSDGQVHIVAQVGSEPAVVNLGFGNLKPLLRAQILTHPYPGRFTVVRWTAPQEGRYNIGGRWLDLDNHGGNGISCHVVIRGVVEFETNLPNDSVVDIPLQTKDLQAGDVVDFVVGANGDHSFDNTAFNAAIGLAPGVEIAIAGTEDGRLNATQGQDIDVTVIIPPGVAPDSIELRDNGRVVARDDAAPYSLRIDDIESGLHRIQAVAVDSRGVEGASNEIVVTVSQPGATGARSTRRAAASSGDGTRTERAEAGFTYFFNAQSGSWDEPNNWFRLPDFNVGVPGPNDDAFITYFVEGSGGAVVTINRKIDVKTLTVGSENKLMAQPGAPRFEVGVAARDAVYLSDATLEGFELVVGRGAEFTNNFDSRFVNMAIFNNGNITYSGPGRTVGDAATELHNNGSITLQRPPASNLPVQLEIPAVQHSGGLLAVQPGGSLLASNLQVNGEMRLGNILSQNGVNLITDNGAGLISDDGSSLIGSDGATLIGPDGATLIGSDGATIISRDGAGLEKAGPSSQWQARAAATSAQGIVLGPGAVVSGRGNFVGDVINQAGFIAPGSSADVIRILGNYTQEQDGTMLLEVGGTTANPPQFDQLQVRGTANLGGKLIVKAIDGFTPASGDSFSPLSYDAVSGSFSSISSNAQVNFGPDGMTMEVSGVNPPAPKALNIATRMRVETGDNVLIAGFIVTGSQPKRVLVRGIGPSLPVPGALANPTLSLDDGAFFNDDWRSDQQSDIEATTIPPSNDLEAAIVVTLEPGAHTAVLRGKDDGTGVGLVEVYDLESGTPAQLANISTRGQVQTGDNVMIGGFIIGGDYPARVLLRAIGPSLPVEGALQDTTLELVDSNGATISNDNWRATQEAEILATTVPPTNDREAAIVATLVPGAYTAIVRGKDDTVGVALVEGYTLQ